jgi:shikimate kinase
MGRNEILLAIRILQNETYTHLFWRKECQKLWKLLCLQRKNPTQNQQSVEKQILEALKKRAATLDELAIMLHYPQKKDCKSI